MATPTGIAVCSTFLCTVSTRTLAYCAHNPLYCDGDSLVVLQSWQHVLCFMWHMWNYAVLTHLGPMTTALVSRSVSQLVSGHSLNSCKSIQSIKEFARFCSSCRWSAPDGAAMPVAYCDQHKYAIHRIDKAGSLSIFGMQSDCIDIE